MEREDKRKNLIEEHENPTMLPWLPDAVPCSGQDV